MMARNDDQRWFAVLQAAAQAWGQETAAGVMPAVVSAIIRPEMGRLVSLGVNGVPMGLEARPERLDPNGERAFWCEHSERAALYHALASGADVKGAEVYSTMFPCADCMRGIIAAGIVAVKTPKGSQPSSAYRLSVEAARKMAAEIGIAMVDVDLEA